MSLTPNITDTAAQSTSKHTDELITNTTKQTDETIEQTTTKTEDVNIVKSAGEEVVEKSLEECIKNCGDYDSKDETNTPNK